MLSFKHSQQLFKIAQSRIPGGVNSPVRAFKNVGSTPIMIEKGSGSHLWDCDGNQYLDFCGSWGPLILGHADPDIVEAVKKQIDLGLTFGACSPLEIEMACLLHDLIPSMDKFRLVTSGTEATMTALRIARAATKRYKFIKFDGCYHGHSDSFLKAAGSGLLTGGIMTSDGVSPGTAADTLVANYNDIHSVQQLFLANPNEIAAVIVEPIAANMGLVPPLPDFLNQLAELTHQQGALLIFDEVITAFRLAPTTYAEYANLSPDLTTLGKIIGGGLPIGAIGGKAELMDLLSPEGAVYQAGTLSGNPIALAAGITTLKKLKQLNPYPQLTQKTMYIEQQINSFFANLSIPGQCISMGSMFTIFFSPGYRTKHPFEKNVAESRNPPNYPLLCLKDVQQCNLQRFSLFFREMLQRGFYLPPAQFETAFLSTAHSDAEIHSFLNAVQQTLSTLHDL